MNFSLTGPLALLLGLANASPQEKPPTPAEQLKAIEKEFSAAGRMLWEAKTDEERAKAAELGFKAAPRFLELAEKYPNDPVAFDALIAVVNQVMWIENNTQHPGYGKDNPVAEGRRDPHSRSHQKRQVQHGHLAGAIRLQQGVAR